MDNARLTGFAHGAAGIIYFLAEYWSRFGDANVERALHNGVDWLVDQARTGPHKHSLAWPTRESGSDYWTWWCHGSPGIALAFLKLFEVTKDTKYSDLARRALSGYSPERRHSNLSQCHGLTGLGEIYLEAASLLGDEGFLHSAEGIADLLVSLGRRSETGNLTWHPELQSHPTADLMIGGGGIVHFLLRIAVGPRMLRAPLLS